MLNDQVNRLCRYSCRISLGLTPGDEAKGKITSHLAGSGGYDMVARWSGGNNAGHTVFVNGKKYKTHLIPSGVFHGIPSIIGPGCVVHPESFYEEIEYLESSGFDTSLVKVSPKAHIVTKEHIDFDKKNLAGKLGTTSRGIAPVYADKHARTGLLAEKHLSKEYLWDNTLRGRILCEGAQGFWLDIDHGNYPFVTSSVTLPYGACSIGFPPQKIRNIWGAAKIYDTRSGEDPLFPASLLDDPVLLKIADAGQEYGVTTGRRRKVNWLDVDRLIHSINITGTTRLVISKCDVLRDVNEFGFLHNSLVEKHKTLEDMQESLRNIITECCPLIEDLIYSYSPEEI